MDTQIRNEIYGYCEKVIGAFEKFLNRSLKKAFSPLPQGLKKAAIYSLSTGGKRIRPLLFLSSVESAAGSDPEPEIYNFAVGIELIHTYTLVHDDLPSMDDDVERRGKPTVHVAFGESTALLTGDLLLTEGMKFLIHPDVWASIPSDVLRIMVSRMLSAVGGEGVVAGQYLDKQYEDKNPEGKYIKETYRLKTGEFLSACITCGFLAGRKEVQTSSLKLLEEAGVDFGYAYQIANDIFDQLHRQRDKEKGKATLVKIWGIERAKKEYEKFMDSAFKKIAKATEPGSPLIMALQYIDDLIKQKWIS